MDDTDLVFQRFPANTKIAGSSRKDKLNPAIKLYGRRLYRDQTSVEYLAEFLLAFTSPKLESGKGVYTFSVLAGDDKKEPCYYPKSRVALKLFTFFPTSKLETRHPVHRKAYINALTKIETIVDASNPDEKKEATKILQSLLTGFSGVSKNRTWVTYCFLPASGALLSREVNWEHMKSLKDSNKDQVIDWETSVGFFSDNLRNFMGRGGELLFLQLANFFEELSKNQFTNEMNDVFYGHIKNRAYSLKDSIEEGLKFLLDDSSTEIHSLVNVVESTLSDYKISEKDKPTSFGWVPRSSRVEAFLFATEIDSICKSGIGVLDKIELLQTLCTMQVLRTLCFQSRRIDENLDTTEGFIGNYVWIVADPNEETNGVFRKMAQNSFRVIESMLFRNMRSPLLNESGDELLERELKNCDDNCYRHFNKFSKEIGLVIPRQGSGTRFALHQGLLRFLVAALIQPGERIRLTKFYQRAFSHYGIAIGGEQLKVALQWVGKEADGDTYAVTTGSAWVEEALKQGGFLVELSDAVSMVTNPSKEN